MNPLGRVSFQFLRNIGHAELWRKNQEQMNVIFNAVDQQRLRAKPLEYSAHIGEEPRPQFGIKKRLALIGAEQNMDE